MCRGLACLVSAVDVDSSHNAIKLAAWCPEGLRGAGLVSQLLPKAEEDPNDKARTQK